MPRLKTLLFNHLRLITVLSLTVLSCTTTQHVKKVDKEVYATLNKIEKEIYKKKSNFTIGKPLTKEERKTVTNDTILKRSQASGNITLDLPQTISYAIENSRAYQSAKETLYLSALSLNDAQIPYGLNQRSGFNTNRTRAANGDQTVGAGSNNSISTLLRGGGNIGASIANDLLKFVTGGTDRSISSIVSFNLMQPLLRGRGAEIAAESLTQSHRNVIYQMRTFRNFQQNFSRDIVIRYLRLIQQQQQVTNEQKNLNSRRENYEYLKARSIDRASLGEVADAEQDVLAAETRFNNVEANFESALDTFKIFIGMPPGMTLKLNYKELDKVVEIGLIPFPYTEKAAHSIALKNRAALLNEVDRFEDTRRSVLISADALKTQLNFVSNASLANSGDQWQKLNFDDIRVSVGLELDLPINQERERNSYRRSLINFDSTVRGLSQTHDDLNILIKLRMREINQFRKDYIIQVGALKLAENRVEGDRLRLKSGDLLFRRLSESQDALINAQNSITDALVDYQESRLRLFEELGVLDIEQPYFWLK